MPVVMQNGYSLCHEVENIPRSFVVRMRYYLTKKFRPKTVSWEDGNPKWGLVQSGSYFRG